MKIRTNQNKKVTLTAVNLKKLSQELRILTKVVRPKIISEIKTARKQGDLSENAEYDAAKQKQSVIEKQIAEINQILNNYHIVEEKDNNVARIGKTVIFKHLGNSQEMKFKIGTFSDFNIEENVISNDSPLGMSVIGKKAGDKAYIKGIKGSYWIEIVKIQ